MFPTSGYFKSIPCPYFNTSVCTRPNCHFKHQKASTSDRRNAVPSYSTSTARTPSYSTAKSDSSAGTSGTVKSRRAAYRAATLQRPHYQHAPFPTGPSALVYKPTPISELNKVNAPSKEEQEATTSDAVISAEFQVIGQSDVPSNATSADIASELGLPSLEDGSGDAGDAWKPAPELTSLPDFSPPLTIDEPPLSPETPAPEAAASPESEAVQPVEKVKVKRVLSKREHEEFVDLFGDGSDEEVKDDSLCISDDEDDVVEVLPPPPSEDKQSLVDLTADTSSSDGESEPCDNNTHNIIISKKLVKREKHSKHSAIEKSKRKASRENSHEHSEPKKRKKTDQIVVSSADSADQCKELFTMYERDEPMEDDSTDAPPVDVSVPECTSSKQRTARGSEEMSRNVVRQKSSVLTPQEIVYKRYAAMQAEQKKRKESTSTNSNSSSKLISNNKVDYNSTPGLTSSRTYKGTERKAHQPQSKKIKESLERPRILPVSNAKVAATVRQLKLNVLIDECLKIYTNQSEAFARAKSEEEVAYSRASSKFIYTNLIVNVIKKLRDEQGTNKTSKPHSMVSHESVLAGKSASKFTVGLKRRGSISLTKEDMLGDLLFKKLRGYVLTESQLVENGYPRSDTDKPGHALIQWSHYDKVPNNKGNVRTCRRCGRGFRVEPDGDYTTREECVYHWGKSFQTRVHGTVDMYFSCCQGKPGTEGCTICVGHVHETNKYEDLTGYMKTFAKDEKDYCGVYALDCEMVYTTRGLEIARVTVINDKLGVMLDSLIRPAADIIDYNTRFSGLTAENFKNVDTSLKDVQAILLNMLQEDTVLIGHSLNSDLVALKLIHNNVVDTALVWPHKHGLPYKRGLKTLMLEILNKLIQEAGSAGHDSSEDAAACMELMKWKVFQDYMKDNR